MNVMHFSRLVLIPTLRRMDVIYNKNKFASKAAMQLLLGTAVHESLGLRYLKQTDALGKPRGPALGVYQMEPNTLNSLYNDYLMYHGDLLKIINTFDNEHSTREFLLISNLAYATVATRLNYFWKPKRLPEVGDIEGLAAYWKKFYNTPKGKGTVEEFILNYERYVTEKCYG